MTTAKKTKSKKSKKMKLSVVENHINALHSVYLDAAKDKNYIICDMIRLEMQRILTGQSLSIKIDSGLNLNPNDIFR